LADKHKEVVQLLIAPTAAAGDFNAQDTEGNSALMLATSGCHSTIMGKLLEVGATVSSAVLIPMIKPETTLKCT
jgi:ankyrin repeat protein